MKELLKKYKYLSPAIKASLWFMICSIIQKGISFFVVPIYTRMLTTTEYGVYNVYLSWTSIVYIFATLNIHAGVYNNGMVKYEKNRDVFTSAVQGLSTITCIIVSVVLFSLSSIIEKYAHLSFMLVVFMMFHIFFNASFNYWIARKKFEYQYRGIVVATIILAITTPALAISLMTVFQNKTEGFILGTVLAQAFIGIILYYNNIKKGKRFYDKEIWKYCFLFNVPLIPHYLSYVVLGQADRIMIENICGPSDAGIYSLAYQLSLVINLVTNAIDGSFNPWTYQKIKSGDYHSINRISTYLIIVFAIGVIGLNLTAPELLLIVAPSDYQPAKWVIPPVVAGCFFLFVAGTFMRVEFYHERNKIIMIASSTTAIINILLNAILIPCYGFIAAAYTTLISYIIFCIFHYIVMLNTCKKNNYTVIPYNGKIIGIITLITTVLSITFMALYPYPLIRYTIIGIIIFICICKRNNLINLFKEIKKYKE